MLINYIIEKGIDVDTWTHDELIEVVKEFKATFALPYNEH